MILPAETWDAKKQAQALDGTPPACEGLRRPKQHIGGYLMAEVLARIPIPTDTP